MVLKKVAKIIVEYYHSKAPNGFRRKTLKRPRAHLLFCTPEGEEFEVQFTEDGSGITVRSKAGKFMQVRPKFSNVVEIYSEKY